MQCSFQKIIFKIQKSLSLYSGPQKIAQFPYLKLEINQIKLDRIYHMFHKVQRIFMSILSGVGSKILSKYLFRH